MKSPKITWIGTGWKMNKLRADAVGFANTLKASAVANSALAQTFVLPPFPYIAEVADILKDTRVNVGAQNMHWEEQGAWTEEISAPMAGGYASRPGTGNHSPCSRFRAGKVLNSIFL